MRLHRLPLTPFYGQLLLRTLSIVAIVISLFSTHKLFQIYLLDYQRIPLWRMETEDQDTDDKWPHIDERWSDIPCISTKTDPVFKVCLHDTEKDIIISQDLKETGLWERSIYSSMGVLFQKDKLLGLIDVGANIGFYTLYAAALGRKVIAIEPFEDNVVRLKKAIHLNNFTHLVTVLQNFVTDRRGVGVIQKHPNKQGGTRVRMDGVNCLGNCKSYISTNLQVESLCLDDLVDKVQTKRAIMKIDIEGYEHLAFQKAAQLLDNVFIPSVFMDWHLMKKVKGESVNDSEREEKLVEQMITLLVQRNYSPYKRMKDYEPLDVNDWFKWPSDIVWKYEI